MTTVDVSVPVGLRTRAIARSRRVKDRLAVGLIWSAVVAVLLPLGFLLVYVVQKGLRIVDLAFLTESIPISSRREGPGMGPAIVGTLLITGGATAIAVPLGVLGAVYNNEYGGRGRFAAVIRFMSDVMSGVPSIVMGLFVYTLWVLRFGQSGFAGSLALASLMLPIVLRTTESMLSLVPADLREASYALGARKSRTILTVVLPAALPGITSGALLAVARAAGETAPLLFTIGTVRRVNTDLLEGTNTALSAQIFRNAQLPFIGAQDRAWGAALTLIVLVFVLTVAARLVAARFTVR